MSDWTFRDMRYSIIEEQSYTRQAANIGDVKRVDEALEGIMDVLCNNPEIFPLVPSTQDIRLAKTNRFVWANGVIPKLRVWFTVRGTEVHLLTVKAYADEED